MLTETWSEQRYGSVDEEDHAEYSHVNDADAKAIVDALKNHLGGTMQEVDDKTAAFALAGKQNPFAEKKNKVLPWTKIEDKGMKKLLDNCLAHSKLPPQVWRRAYFGRPCTWAFLWVVVQSAAPQLLD